MAIKVKTFVYTATWQSVEGHFDKIDQETNAFLATLNWSQVRDITNQIFEVASGGKSWVIRTIVYSEEVLAQGAQPRPSVSS